MSEEPDTYRIRRRCGSWYVSIYRGYSLKHFQSELGPFDFPEANEAAILLDIPDGDKGPEQSNVRGHNATR